MLMQARPFSDCFEMQHLRLLLYAYCFFTQVRHADVLSTWSGIRPLAADPTAQDASTSNIVRDHLIFSEPNGLITVTGGLTRSEMWQGLGHAFELFAQHRA
jgi:glycerol-3-phosphate dehydrogenase